VRTVLYNMHHANSLHFREIGDLQDVLVCLATKDSFSFADYFSVTGGNVQHHSAVQQPLLPEINNEDKLIR